MKLSQAHCLKYLATVTVQMRLRIIGIPHHWIPINPLLLHENSEVVHSAERLLSNKTNDDEEPLVNITGKYLLKVKEENRLTQTTVQNIAKATSELFLVACRRLKQKIEETLKDENAKRFPEIEAAFEDVTSPFEQLNAKWMFPEFTRDKLPYVVSYITFKSCQSEKKKES